MIIKDDYFEWLSEICTPNFYDRGRHRNLLSYLFSVDFIVRNPEDQNRYDDGLSLRYRYSVEEEVDISSIRYEFRNKNCSVLEMLVALAIRCEEDIMADEDYGDRTGYWFWSWINNLEIDLTNDEFDEGLCDRKLADWLLGYYERDGYGSIFYIPDCEYDLRDLDIWLQLNYWCEYNYN